MRAVPVRVARVFLAAAMVASLAWVAGCGAAAPTTATGGGSTPAATTGGTTPAATGTAAASPAGASAGKGAGAAGANHRFTANPTMRVVSEIILVAPVVPFTAKQVSELVPILQGLAKDPNQPAATLSAKAKAMTAILTSTQVEALKNMTKSHYTGSGSTGGRFAGGRPPAGASTRGAPGAAAGANGKTPTRPRFNAGAIYQRAIEVLQGKVTGGFSAPGTQGVTGVSTQGA